MSTNILNYNIDEIQHILDYSLLKEPQQLTDKEKKDIKNNLGIKENSEISEQTIADWGFTKNKGDYTKPSTGIPKSDLDSSVQSSLNKADTALQSHQSLNGYATEVFVTNAIEQAITTTLHTEV